MAKAVTADFGWFSSTCPAPVPGSKIRMIYQSVGVRSAT